MRLALLLLVLGRTVLPAYATPTACPAAVLAAPTQHVQAVLKALAGCARRQTPDCDVDPRTAASVAKADQRLRTLVVSACCGVDGRCGTIDDDPAALNGWEAGFCPNLDRGDCNGLVSDAGDVADCLACIGRSAARDVLGLTQVVGAAAPLSRCAGALAKEGTRLAKALSKALGRCWSARAEGLHANPCPAPGDGVAASIIATARDRARAAICRACGGADRACGGGDDVQPATLGFPATCPAVTPPGGSACAGSVTRLTDLAACVDCVTTHDAECAGQVAASAFATYPADCAEPPGVCAAGVECTTAADCPAGYACLDNGSGTTRYCVGSTCALDAECSGGAVCRQYCTFAGCGSRRCVCPGFSCGGADEICLDDGGIACRQLCTQDSDCPPPLGVCVNSTFGAGLCISSTPCQ